MSDYEEIILTSDLAAEQQQAALDLVNRAHEGLEAA